MQHVEGAGCREWKLWLDSVQTSKRQRKTEISQNIGNKHLLSEIM